MVTDACTGVNLVFSFRKLCFRLFQPLSDVLLLRFLVATKVSPWIKWTRLNRASFEPIWNVKTMRGLLDDGERKDFDFKFRNEKNYVFKENSSKKTNIFSVTYRKKTQSIASVVFEYKLIKYCLQNTFEGKPGDCWLDSTNRPNLYFNQMQTNGFFHCFVSGNMWVTNGMPCLLNILYFLHLVHHKCRATHLSVQ